MTTLAAARQDRTKGVKGNTTNQRQQPRYSTADQIILGVLCLKKKKKIQNLEYSEKDYHEEWVEEEMGSLKTRLAGAGS